MVTRFKSISHSVIKKMKELQHSFEQSSFGRLSNRLLFNLAMLTAIPLILVVFYMRSVTQDAMVENIKNQNNQIAHRIANEFKLFLKIPEEMLEILGETDEIKKMNPQIQKIIIDRSLSQYHPVFNRIFTIDTTGLQIATSGEEHYSTNYVNESFFSYAMGGDTSYISPLYINNPNEPFVISSLSIRQSNQIVGVLAGEISLMFLWELVEEIRIGEMCDAFLLDREGRIIAGSQTDSILNELSATDKSILSDAYKFSESNQVVVSPSGVRLLSTYVYVEEVDWIIAIQQPMDDAVAIANTMFYEVLAFVVLILLVAFFLATRLEKRITEPIKSLIRGVKRYAEGDLEYRIQIERYEEIALLAEEFNTMAQSLLKNQRKLRRVERLAAMSKFATLVSHEIRNPLNSMNINMKILKREVENSNSNAEKRQKYFNIITSEINRMENLIKNFLMISRTPRFDFVLNDMHGILEEVILLHGENSRQQNVRIEKEFHDGTSIANVDRDQMKQVFHNIIINALQAMPAGGELKIKTCLKKMNTRMDQNVQFIRMKFIDSGVGIPEDKINDIFELYYTMKRTGTGLGLAIARQIVEGHFGAIDVKSKLGEGTTVTVSIPTNSDLDTV